MARKARDKSPDDGGNRKSSNVPGAYLGFSLQATRFLARILKAAPGDVVCLEVFDDVGVERSDGSRIAEQNKSNLTHNPLSDRSIDLWKTLRIWVDAVMNGELDPDRTSFELYTSNPAGGSIAQSFHDATTIDDATTALARAEKELLGNANGDEIRSVSEQLHPHLIRVFAVDKQVVAKIVRRFSFESSRGSPHDDLKTIRWGLGWIKRETDQLLEKRKPARITQEAFHKAMLHYVQSHDRIDILRSFGGRFPAQPLQPGDNLRTYVRQLNLIEVGDDDILSAINDFMRAATDRTDWSERGLIDESSLDEYSEELYKSWSNKKTKVSIGYSHKSHVDQGRLLYTECLEHSLPLDGMPTPPHFTRGSWHSLADDQAIGWHPQFKNELQRFIDGDTSTPEMDP
jgi:hypothetical protein